MKNTQRRMNTRSRMEPLSVDMLSYLDNVQKMYNQKALRVRDGSDKEEYRLDLKYITTFALIGIFEKLDEISKGIRSVSRS